MKELKRTKTIEEVYAYEAKDGKQFTTKEECEKYEQSAEYAVEQMFESICVKRDGEARFSECYIFENYGYGGEDYCYVVADIKTEEELKIANMYGKMRASMYFKPLEAKYIGKRVLIAIGDKWSPEFYVRGTEEEMVEEFKRTMATFFRPDEKG